MLYKKHIPILFLLFILAGTTGYAQLGSGKISDAGPRNSALLGGAAILVTAPTLAHGQGVQFTVPIRVSSVTGQNVLSFQFDLEYDPEVIQYNGCSNAGTISAGRLLTCNLVGPGPGGAGVAHANAFGAFPFEDSETGVGGILVNLTFTVVGTAGQSSPLVFQTFYFNEGNPIAVTVPGVVTVTSPTAGGVSVGGTALGSDGRALYGARVTLTDENGMVRMALTNPFGYFTFSDVPAGESYVISATARGYTFESTLMTIGDEITDIVLIGQR